MGNAQVQAALDEHAALTGTADPNWPDPDEDGHVWEHVELECPTCDATVRIHRQKPAWLAAPAGVKVECPNGHAFKLGGYTAPPAASYVLECLAKCHATFDPNTVEQSADGEWTCPACSTVQRHIALAETAEGAQTGATA